MKIRSVSAAVTARRPARATALLMAFAALAAGLVATAPRPAHAASLPTHILTGYWQDFDNGARTLRLRDVPPDYDMIAVAFADTDFSKQGAVTFTVHSDLSNALGGYTDSDFINDVKAVHSQGRHVILSIGGADGTVQITDPNSAANFVTSVLGLIQQFGFDGVDIDLEAGISVPNLTSALQQLAAKDPGMIIALAPQTIDILPNTGAYLQLIDNIKSILTVVNTQFYNSGGMPGCDGTVYNEGSVDFITSLDCYLLQHIRPDQVGMGFPASPSGAGSGYVSPSVIESALSCLANGTGCGNYKPPTKYPSIRGVMDWSISWDATSGYAFSHSVRPFLTSLPGGTPPASPLPPPPPTPTAPTAPTHLTGAALGGGNVSLTWTAPTSNGGAPIGAYAVYAFSYSGAAKMSETGGTQSMTVSGLTPGNYYVFTATAWNGSLWSPWSAWSTWVWVT